MHVLYENTPAYHYLPIQPHQSDDDMLGRLSSALASYLSHQSSRGRLFGLSYCPSQYHSVPLGSTNEQEVNG